MGRELCVGRFSWRSGRRWPALAVNASAEPRSVVDPANLRSGPGLAWPIIGVVPANTSVEILTCAQGNTTAWCKVKFGDSAGYIAAAVLAPHGSSGVMVAPLATRYSVHIYSAPSRGAAVLGVIPPETVVDFLGMQAEGLQRLVPRDL